MLTMASCLVLIFHVIRSIPVYYLMLFELSTNNYQQLEYVYCEFFWGLGEHGNPRIPLIAWENVVRDKMGGGLGLTDFHRMSKAMKYRSVMKLLHNYDTEWVGLAHELIRKGIAIGRWAKEIRSWTTQEFLLLSLDAHIPSRTLKGVLAGWLEPSSVLALN